MDKKSEYSKWGWNTGAEMKPIIGMAKFDGKFGIFQYLYIDLNALECVRHYVYHNCLLIVNFHEYYPKLRYSIIFFVFLQVAFGTL